MDTLAFRRATGIALIASVLILSVAIPHLQSQARQQPRIPRHDAAAIIKLVAIRVLDQNGRPVTDLKKEDFLLYDNKELKKITEFEVHRLDEPASEPEEAKAVPGASISRERNLKYFLFLDIQGSDVVGTMNSKEAALHFVGTKLKPGDEAAVLSFSPMTGLRLHQYLTSDLDKIRKAIKKARELPPTPGFVSSIGTDIILDSSLKEQGIASEHGVSGGVAVGGMAVAVPGLDIFARTPQEFHLNMSELAKALQYIPGAKNLLFFSGRNVSKTLGREFAASNTAVFTVNSKNWIVHSILSLSIKEKHIWAEHPLKEFALASGGQYFADVKDVQTIADEIQALTGNYYVLGYYIDEKWDGKFHEIKVEVKREGHRVFAQDGYYNPRPFGLLSEIEKQLHLFELVYGDKPAIQDLLEIPLEPFFGSGGPAANMIILSKMLVDEKAGIPPGKVELFLIIFDQDREAVQSRRWEIDLKKHAQEVLYPYFVCSLPPGEYECRLIARDRDTGQSVLGRSFFQVPEPAASSLQLFSPLLLVPGKEAQFLRISEEKKQKKEPPSIIKFFPLLPKGCSPLVKVLDAGVTRLWAVVPCRFPPGLSPEVELDVHLIDLPAGDRFRLDSEILEVRESEEGAVFLLLEVNLPELEPGEYELEIVALEPAAQIQEIVKTSLSRK